MAISREQPMRPYLDALGEAVEELNEAIENYEIPDGSVTTAKIADGAVNMSKLADDVIIPQPTDAQVTSAVNTWLAAHPEATTTVQDGSVTTAKLADGAVTDAKLADGGVKTAKLENRAVTQPKISSVGVVQIAKDSSSARETLGALTEGYSIKGEDADHYVIYNQTLNYDYYYLQIPPIKNCRIRKSMDYMASGQRISVEEADGKVLFRMGYSQRLTRQFLSYAPDDTWFEVNMGALLSQFPTAARIGFTIYHANVSTEWCHVYDGYSIDVCEDEGHISSRSRSPWIATADMYSNGFSMSGVRDSMLSLTINRYGYSDLYLRGAAFVDTGNTTTDFKLTFWATPNGGSTAELYAETEAISSTDTGVNSYDVLNGSAVVGQVTLDMDALKSYQLSSAFVGDPVHFGLDIDAVRDQDWLVDELYKGIRTATCIGDSLTIGTNAMDGSDENTKWTNSQSYAWGTMLAGSSNAEYEIVGHGGYTSRQWLEAYLSTVTSGTTKQVYFIGLGVNDAAQSVSVGSVSDINDASPTSNPDTFCGNMGQIIQGIKTAHPHSKILVFNIPRTDSNVEPFNAAIAAIVAHYSANVYLIDVAAYMSDYTVAYSPIDILSNHKHYPASGYAAIARVMSRAIGRYMYEHADKFRYLEFITTSDAQYIPASSE